MAQTKIIIFSAPSGSGKSTLIGHLMEQEKNLHFSISATNRPPRGKEQNGVEYYFLTTEEFKRRLDEGDFLEHEEVYPGRFYGTLKSEIDRQLREGKNVVCDVDVLGAQRIKKHYGERALSLFIEPPSIDELRRRLEARATDAPEVIDSRIARAQFELEQAAHFDCRIVNDKLDEARQAVVRTVREFLSR